MCPACSYLLEMWREEPHCLRCGRPRSGTGDLCRDCLATTPPFRLARAAAPYDGPFRQAVQKLKFQGALLLAEPLGQLMAETVLAEPMYTGVELVVPVPLHRRKLRSRGFNQSSLLGKEIGNRLGLPLEEKVLIKERETKDQIGLTREQRLANLRGAFTVDKPQLVKGKSLLLVDDIFTTGSTVSHSAAALLAAGAEEVSVITWAAGIN
ncbi:MAG: ComF family protein [Clostridia bacterium]|nr:ComF family protein [Clostridia bacterium]